MTERRYAVTITTAEHRIEFDGNTQELEDFLGGDGDGDDFEMTDAELDEFDRLRAEGRDLEAAKLVTLAQLRHAFPDMAIEVEVTYGAQAQQISDAN